MLHGQYRFIQSIQSNVNIVHSSASSKVYHTFCTQETKLGCTCSILLPAVQPLTSCNINLSTGLCRNAKCKTLQKHLFYDFPPDSLQALFFTQERNCINSGIFICPNLVNLYLFTSKSDWLSMQKRCLWNSFHIQSLKPLKLHEPTSSSLESRWFVLLYFLDSGILSRTLTNLNLFLSPLTVWSSCVWGLNGRCGQPDGRWQRRSGHSSVESHVLYNQWRPYTELWDSDQPRQQWGNAVGCQGKALCKKHLDTFTYSHR